MDIELKRKWVEALRSGKYKQIIGHLEMGEGSNCCLGVLSRIVEPEHIPEYGLIRPILCKEDDIHDDGLALLLEKNDGEDALGNLTFPQIADWIEENL